MPFVKNIPLNEINPKWAERCVGFSKVTDVLIRFVPVATLYDAKSDNSDSISLSLDLFLTPKVNITKNINKSWEVANEKEYNKKE